MDVWSGRSLRRTPWACHRFVLFLCCVLHAGVIAYRFTQSLSRTGGGKHGHGPHHSVGCFRGVPLSLAPHDGRTLRSEAAAPAPALPTAAAIPVLRPRRCLADATSPRQKHSRARARVTWMRVAQAETEMQSTKTAVVHKKQTISLRIGQRSSANTLRISGKSSTV